MHHLKIFGQLAMQLGADPRLWTRSLRTGRYMYWDAGYLHYSSSIKELLSAAIASEREACSKYLKQASWIQDPNICDNLKRIAADEQMHAELFTRLFQRAHQKFPRAGQSASLQDALTAALCCSSGALCQTVCIYLSRESLLFSLPPILLLSHCSSESVPSISINCSSVITGIPSSLAFLFLEEFDAASLLIR